jgi:MFS-type transporter involved in bile tolerance (Atg22 family)
MNITSGAASLVNTTQTVLITATGYDPNRGHIYSIPIAITSIIISVFGVVGNLLIIVAIITTKELRNRCQFLIAYLAFADLVASIYYCSIR